MLLGMTRAINFFILLVDHNANEPLTCCCVEFSTKSQLCQCFCNAIFATRIFLLLGEAHDQGSLYFCTYLIISWNGKNVSVRKVRLIFFANSFFDVMFTCSIIIAILVDSACVFIQKEGSVEIIIYNAMKQ